MATRSMILAFVWIVGCAAEPVPPAPWDAAAYLASLDLAGTGGSTDATDAAEIEGGPDSSGNTDITGASETSASADAADTFGSDAAGSSACFDGACDDGNPCTADTCVDATCLHQPLTEPCDDGDACTSSDKCSGGSCVGTAIVCDQPGPCAVVSCLPTQGCTTQWLDGAACDDGNACTNAAFCSAGVCVPAADPALACDDGNPCTADLCVTDLGCSHTPTVADCDDGSACTSADACEAGLCRGVLIDCGDGDPCTQDACDAAVGCVWPAKLGVSCSDGDACTTADTCGTTGCVGGLAANCDDGVGCTIESCDSTKGCQHAPSDVSCDDGVACTTDSCDTAADCQHTAVASVCDDANPCTTDGCDLAADCTHVANELPCSDNDACTLADTCTATVCVGDQRDCLDGNPCTADACDPASGCVFPPMAATCTDGNVCTIDDACSAGACVGGPPLPCQDGNVCTADGCSPQVGCINSLLNIGCDDGNACTTIDLCSANGCVGTELAFCDDGKVCTEDSCLPTQGCRHLMTIDPPCSDGDACTAADHCNGGECVSTSATLCEDNNPCTANLCAPDTGCQFLDQYGSCSDGNACTVGDTCVSGSCFSGSKLNCNDGNPCTIDYCDSGVTPPASNCRHTATPGAECDDGNNCTAGSACDGLTCTGTGADCSDGNACTTDSCGTGGCEHVALVCNDNNTCTTDSCVPATGCKYTVNSAVTCDDANPCTVNTTCTLQGSCVGSDVVCQDNNPCTVDSCNPASGCTFAKLYAGGCTDGNPCTTGDACVSGVCTGNANLNCDDGNVCTTDSCQTGVGCKHVGSAEWTPCGNEASNMACSGDGTCQSFAWTRHVTVVPSGTFAMGCNPSVDSECKSDEYPQHLTTVSAFWLDLFEVTVEKYLKCVDAGVCVAPADGYYADPDALLMPVNYVSLSEAKIYCAWLGKRLPTEAEWEKAARGGCELHGPGETQCKATTWKLPWGDDPVTCDNSIYTNILGGGCGMWRPWNVGSAAGSGPYSHMNLAGNVAEWVDDVYSATWYSTNSNWTNPKGPGGASGSPRVIRGGSWLSNADQVRASARASATPTSHLSTVGFRCARTW